ncbi:MAG TPA: hypothetical protein ENI23_16075 [bacterium]|nr:hypothetical protein [bacterium]
MRLLIIFSLISAFVVGYIASGITMSVGASYERSLEVIEVEVTAYSPSPNQTQGNPFQMASGRIAHPSELDKRIFVAVSRDLIEEYGLEWGDTVWLPFRLEDTMNKRIKNSVDWFVRNKELAKLIGRERKTIIVERR